MKKIFISKILCKCCRTMKQKLSERKYSYKNLYLGLGKVRKTSNLWMKCSAIGLVIAKFFRSKKFVNFLHFLLITPSVNFWNLVTNKTFVLNSLILFTLPMFISSYRSNNMNMVEKHNSSPTKVRGKYYGEKNYTDIYKKSFRNFNNNFDILLPNAFERMKLSRHEFHSSIIPRPEDPIFFERIKTTLIGKRKDEFIYNLNLSMKFLNLYQLHESRDNNYNFKWMVKIPYFRNEVILKPISGERIFIKKSFENKYIINNLFLKQEIKNWNLRFFPFFEPLFLTNFLQNTLSPETVNEIYKNIGRLSESKNNIESDDIEIIMWKIPKYHSNFWVNYHFPLNISYGIICKKLPPRKKIREQSLEIVNLLRLFFRSEKKISISLMNCIGLEKHVMMEERELKRFVYPLTEIKNTNLYRNTLLISEDSNDIYCDKNRLGNNYLLLKNFVNYNFRKYFGRFSNNSFAKLLKLKTLYENKIFKKYLIPWEKSFQQYNIENQKYKKLDLEIHYLFSEIKNPSKERVPYNFSENLEVKKFLKIFFENFGAKNIKKIFTSFQTFAKIHNVDVDTDNIYDQTLIKNSHSIQKSINKLIVPPLIDETNCKIKSANLLTTFLIKNNIWFNYTNSEILLAKSNNDFSDFQSNYEKNFLFYSGEDDVEGDSIIYLQFLKNFLEYKNFKKNFRFFLLNFENDFSGTKYVNLSNFYSRISKQINLASSKRSKIHFLKKVGNIISMKVLEEVETGEGDKGILTSLENEKIENYYNILRYESLAKNGMKNNLLFQSTDKIFRASIQKCSQLKNFKPKLEKKYLRNIDKVFKNYHQIEIELINFFKRNLSIKDFNYKFWFFTSEWWEYSIHIFAETLRKYFVIFGSHFKYLMSQNIHLIRNNLLNFYENRKNLYILHSKWNSRLSFDYTKKIILNFVWSDFRSTNDWNNLYWVIVSLIFFVLAFHKNYFSIFIGSDPINLWTYFENIKYLDDDPRASYLTGLLCRSKMQLDETENWLISFMSNLKQYVRNIRFYLITEKSLNRWLIKNKNLDLSRRKRNLLVQSLITPTRIKEYGFQSYSRSKMLNKKLFGYHTNFQEGLSYLQYVSRILNKDLVNYSLYRADKWVFLASLQKIVSSQTLQQAKHFNPKFQKIPIPLQLGFSCSKGILLVGLAETGRSYLIKNLAADSSVPLLGISINKLMYNKPDVITESWMNILIESLRRLNLILDLAKGMSPCIIWIRNIHQLDVNRSTQNIESDPTFLLGILSKHLRRDYLETRTKNNIIMIGSTHVPQKVDPSLISPDRLDQILNIRLLNTYQRKDKFLILLNRNTLQVGKNLLYLNEFGSRTMGYNLRDLVALTNEISLINITSNKSFVHDDSIKLAFNRQILSFSYTDAEPDYQQNFKILFHKIGKAIVQNMIIKGFTTNPLNISNFLWKKKFYYLSKWYLEPSIDDSIIKESTILVHILGCSAGIAARDSWFLSEKDSKKSISLDKFVENDLDLAFSILETFSSDFPWLETCESQFITHRGREPRKILAKNFLNIMHDGIYATKNKTIPDTKHNSQDLLSVNKNIDGITNKFNNLAWSPRFWRLNFCRSHLFNWVKRPNDFESFNTFHFSKKKDFEGKIHYEKIMDREKQQLFYERILPRVRRRNIEELESQFENILSEEQLEILGFFGSATQYHMEYQSNNKPRFFIGKRVVWNPIASFSRSRNFVFSNQEFFVDEEMLRRLYITYGVRRERERSLSNHRIERFFVGRGYNKDLIDKLSVRWWNQLPIHPKQSLHMLKRIEKIGIRLKRPQIFTPVYLYQRWSIENIPGKFSRVDLLTHRDRWIKFNPILLSDSLTYNIILESYQYLLEFFSSNKLLLNRMTRALLKKKWLFQNEIVNIISSIENVEL